MNKMALSVEAAEETYKLESGISMYHDRGTVAVSDIMIELFNQEENSIFKRIHAMQGKTISVTNQAAMAYSLIKDTIKYEHFSGIGTYLAQDVDMYDVSYKGVEYKVPENDMRDYTLIELFIAVYNRIKDKELTFKIVGKLVD